MFLGFIDVRKYNVHTLQPQQYTYHCFIGNVQASFLPSLNGGDFHVAI